MTKEQQAFLENEFLTLSINGALQHSGTYKTELNQAEKMAAAKKMQAVLRSELPKLALRYHQAVDGNKHVENIKELMASVKKSCGSDLASGSFRFGVAQKALNLYLKYLWCVSLIARPPHCPFDEKILVKLGFADKWTQVDSDTTYLKWVEKAEEKRKTMESDSIADWELREWTLPILAPGQDPEERICA